MSPSMRHLAHEVGAAWTMAQIKDLQADRCQRPLREIAEAMGGDIRERTLYNLLARNGFPAPERQVLSASVAAARRAKRDQMVKAHALRQTGSTWAQVEEAVGWQYTRSALIKAYARFRARAGHVVESPMPEATKRKIGEAARQRVAMARMEDDRGASDRVLLRQALHNLWSPDVPRPRWGIVTRLFGLGSTSAQALCRRFSLNPDDEVGTHLEPGSRCPTCDQYVEDDLP